MKHALTDFDKIDFLLSISGVTSPITTDYEPNLTMNYEELESELKDSIRLRLDYLIKQNYN